MSPQSALVALIVLVGCGPVDRARVDLGDPVRNVAHVSFDADKAGDGSIWWEAGGVEHVVPLGKGSSFETTLLLPSGVQTSLRGRVEVDGELVEGPIRRVRVPKAPKKTRYRARTLDRSRSQIGEGVILLNLYDDKDSYAIAIDAQGDVRWVLEPDEASQRFLRVRPGLDGQSIVIGRWAKNHAKFDDGWITRIDVDADQRRTDTRAVAFHHDWVELPGNRFGWLSWTYDESRLIHGFGEKPVAADAVRVADEGASAGEETVIYDFLADYPGDVFWSCSHMAPGGFAGGDWREWTHANSIAWDDERQAFRLLVRYWDAVVEIGIDGELKWQAGGDASDFELEDWMHHAHATELDGDRLVFFDNGNHQSGKIVTRTVAVDLDYEEGVVRHAWEIEDPRGKYTTFLGDARTLPGGNVLVLYSPEGRIHEYTSDGDLVWEALLDTDMTVGRMSWTDQLTGER